MDNSSLMKPGSHPLEITELKQVIKNRFSFDRRKIIFFTLNSCLLGLALFSLFCAITLESNAQIFRIRNILTRPSANLSSLRSSCRQLETILIPQNLAQLCVIIAAVIGFFGIYQKSKKILFMYPIALAASTVFRLVSTIVIMSYYGTVSDVFPNEAATLVTVEAFFFFVHGLFAFLCFQQFKKAQVEYFIVSKDRERLITDNQMAFEVIKKIIRN